MVSVRERQYIKQNVTKEWLQKNGFFYCKEFSFDDEDAVYSYRFPIIKYKKFTTVEGVIYVSLENGEISLSVKDVPNGCDYRPFFYNEYGNCKPILDKINKSFIKEFNKLGIVENKDEK